MTAAEIAQNYALFDPDVLMDLMIDTEFEAMIPPLSQEELSELEKSLVEHGGARDPLIAWFWSAGAPLVLLDGHNRLAICKRLGLSYRVKAMHLSSREQALQWIQRNQLGRRNLRRQDFTLMLGRLYNQAKRPFDRNRKNPRQKTVDRFAEAYNVDPRTVTRAGSFQAAVKKLGIEDDVATGKLKVSTRRLLRVAKTIPDNPTREQVDEALSRAREVPMAPHRDGGQRRFLVPSGPSDCLKAVRFYAMSFAHQQPEAVGVLVDQLKKIIEEVSSG
jgi:hypothetical protein